MSGREFGRILARRSFFSKLGFGLVAGGAVGASASPAQAQSAAEGGRFQPARHAQDDWLDQIPGTHRYVLDAPTPEGFGNALAFLNNYFNVNQNDYGLKDGDLAVVLIARHMSTLFAYNDAIWAKYGVPITRGGTNFNDPKTKQPPTINLFNSTAYGRDYPEMTNRGTTIDSLVKRGLRFGVCQVSSRGYAGRMAMATGATADAVFNEMVANLMPNARLVPAGIVAVNRAQERGYSLAYC
jgi:intracellular sulfur oxidation DsrE/DsrF family protein